LEFTLFLWGALIFIALEDFKNYKFVWNKTAFDIHRIIYKYLAILFIVVLFKNIGGNIFKTFFVKYLGSII